MSAMLLAVIPASDPLPLPSPPWLLWTLLMLTWVLHVIAMNFVLGGSIIAAIARFRSDDRARRLFAWMGRLMPTAVAAAITFGVAPLLFVQALYGRLFFSSSVLMAWFWFAVVPILIVAYYGTYFLAFRPMSGRGAAIIGSAVALLFLSISFIYSNNMSFMLRPDTFLDRLLENARGVQLNVADPTFFPRWLHMVFGAVAVAAMIVAAYGIVHRRSEEAYGSWVVRHGALWFVVATALNILLGAAWTAALPRQVMMLFMGGSIAASVSLTAGVLLGCTAWGLMIAAMNSARPERLVKIAVPLLVVTLVAMALSRDAVRQGMFSLARFVPAERVDPQWDVIALFVILLVAAFGATAWMITILLRPRGEAADVAKPQMENRQSATV